MEGKFELTDAELESLENEDFQAQLSEMGIRSDLTPIGLGMVLARAEARLGREFTADEREEKGLIGSLLIASDFEDVDEVSVTYHVLDSLIGIF